MNEVQKSDQARLKPFIQGLIDSWDFWLSEQQKKRLSFWGFSGTEFSSYAEPSITHWGYTFTAETFNQPLTFWQRRVARWFHIEAYFNYREIEQTSLKLKQLIHQDQSVADLHVVVDTEGKSTFKNQSFISLIKLQKPASSEAEAPAELSKSVLKQLKFKLNQVLQTAKRLLVKQIIKSVAPEDFAFKAKNFLILLNQAQEAADAQAWIVNRKFEADTIHEYLGKKISKEVLDVQPEQRKYFIKKNLELMTTLWFATEKTKEVKEAVEVQSLTPAAKSPEILRQNPKGVPDSGIGSKESSDTESNSEQEISPTPSSGALVVLESTKTAEPTRFQIAPLSANKKVFFRSLQVAEEDTIDQRAAFDQAAIERDIAEFKQHLLDLNDSDVFEAERAQGLAELRKFKTKKMSPVYHPDKNLPEDKIEAHEIFTTLVELIDKEITLIEWLVYCDPEININRVFITIEAGSTRVIENLNIVGREFRQGLAGIRAEGKAQNERLTAVGEEISHLRKEQAELQKAETVKIDRQRREQEALQEQIRQQEAAAQQRAEQARQEDEERAVALQRKMDQQAEEQRRQTEEQRQRDEEMREEFRKQNKMLAQMAQFFQVGREVEVASPTVAISPTAAPNAILFDQESSKSKISLAVVQVDTNKLSNNQ